MNPLDLTAQPPPLTSLNPTLVYIVLAGFLSLCVRLAMSLLKACDRKEEEGFWREFRFIFSGFSPDKDRRDYWYSFLVGWGEICVFPILLKLDVVFLVGGWLALKVLPQWRVWAEKRQAFNLFLISVMLVLLFSFWMTDFVIPKSGP